ncbi:MAG: right-handed parallel beta-helix repeat-containing protein [Nitrososphaera sp.]
MEPKSIAFCTAVAVSILAVISATTIPALAQSTPAKDDTDQGQQATSTTNNESTDNSDSQAADKEQTNKPAAADKEQTNKPAAADKEQTNKPAASDDPNNEKSNAANDEKSSDPATQSLGLADSSPLVSCGETITTSVELTSDLVCDGTALVIGSDDVNVNLNGHSIRSGGGVSPTDQSMGYAASSGISVIDADNVAISGLGSIDGFGTGISIIGSSGTQVTDLQFADNGIGVLMSGADETELSRNSMSNNGIGIVSDTSNDGVIVFNSLVTNERQGILLTASNDNVIAADDLYGNGDYGVSLDVQSSGNTVDYVTAFGHEIADMNNANGLPLSVNNNNFGAHNNCETSTPAGLCPGGNTSA